MIAKDKARELVDKYDDTLTYLESKAKAKQCALIAIDQMISVLPFTDINTSLGKYCEKERAYLEQVRNEIQKL